MANAQKCLHRSEMDYDWRAGLIEPASERGASVICKKCVVGGRVQGVFYRATAAQRARELGIAGHAKNLPDGRVEVLAIGDAGAVETFVKWLWTGSSASKVTSVEATDVLLREGQHPNRFTTG